MDPCILAETGISALDYIAVALFLCIFSLVVFKKFSYKPFILVFTLVFSFNMLAPIAISAQSEDCTEVEPVLESPELSLVDDVIVMPFAGFGLGSSAEFTVDILTNDLPPEGDSIDWATVDLNPTTPGIQTQSSVYHPDFPNYWCGEFWVSTIDEELYLYIEETCVNDVFDTVGFPDLPVTFTTLYTAFTLNGVVAAESALVSFTLEAQVVFANDDQEFIDCVWDEEQSRTINLVDNDTTDIGIIDPTTVDLDPETPGKQTSVILTTLDNSFSAEVDSSGIVTVTILNGSASINGNHAIGSYTVQNDEGNFSNVASFWFSGGCG